MMMILAWKNIWGNKKRSFIILAATAVGLACGLFSAGVLSGLYEALVQSAISRELGHIQIHSVDFVRDQEISQTLTHVDGILSILEHTPTVEFVVTHSVIEGMASSATAADGVRIIAVEPDAEQKVTSISRRLIEGTYLNGKNSVVIGKKLADRLKLKLHGRFVASFSAADGTIIDGTFRVEGIYQTEASTFDGMNVFIRQEDLASLLGTPAPIHEIVLRTRSLALVDSTANMLRVAFPSVEVETWKQLAPELKYTADTGAFENTILLGIILFALLFGLTNTLLMSVLDRIHDFGILLAIGLNRRRLFSMIMVESLFLSFTGGIIGVVVGWGVTEYFGVRGIDLTVFSAGASSFGVPSILYPMNQTFTYVELAIMMVITSVIAGL